MISKKVYEIIEFYNRKEKRDNLETTNFELTQRETIKRINRYQNDQFFTAIGTDAIFWNISTPRVDHFAKNLDLDTKDLMPYGIGEFNMVQAWILRMKLSKWLRDNAMAIKLNELTQGLAIYGSIIWKKKKEKGELEVEEIDYSDIYFDETAKRIKDTDVVELHYLCEEDLREKENVWNNVSELKTKLKDSKEEELEIWEYWGEYEGMYYQCIGYGKGEQELILFEDEMTEEQYDKNFPYRDFHLGRYRGRFLRVGVYERLFKLQERANTLVNENATTTRIASTLLLRSADGETLGNVLEQVQSGQIIQSNDLQQIPLQNPAIQSFINEMALIERQADKLCLTPDVVTGDQMPSGVPFRSIAVYTNAARSAFKQMRESVGEELAQMLEKDIVPQLAKEWKKGDIIEVAGDESDVQVYDEAVKRVMERDFVVNNILDGQVIQQMPDFGQEIEQNIEKVGRKIDVPDNFFNFDWGIRYNVTGEMYDKQQQNDAMFNALLIMKDDPQLYNIPLFRQYVENNGISYWKLKPEQMAALLQNKQGKQASQPIGAGQDKLLSMVNSNQV